MKLFKLYFLSGNCNWRETLFIDSPSNVITFDCGVTGEMGEDPVEVCRYFASRNRINHVHFRNVRYKRGLYAKHPHMLDYNREYPEGSKRSGDAGGGGHAAEIFNAAFVRAMMFAVMSI